MLIGYHRRQPPTSVFGTGTLFSSDGQRFPARGKSVTARALSRYFANEALSTYTHVTDQHTTYGTKIIVATKREAHYVLDEILGNATDIPVTVTNSAVAWTTEYYGLAVDSMRTTGRSVDDEVLAHISPAHSENINFFGSIDVDIEGELAQLGPTGYRPLCVRNALF